MESHPLRDAISDGFAVATSPFHPRGKWGGLVVRITTPLRGPGDTGLEAATTRLDAFTASIGPTLSGLERSLVENEFSHNANPRKNYSTDLLVVGY